MKESDIKFIVSESYQKDMDKPIARIDINIMRKMGLMIGDIIEITGKKSALAKLMPLDKDDAGKEIIRINKLIRREAEVDINEEVTIKNTNAKQALKVYLKAIRGYILENLEKYKENLLGYPLKAGQKISLKSSNNEVEEFIVTDTIPNGVVVINNSTIVSISNFTKTKEKKGVSFDDIGGLHKELLKIREMVELPILYPQIFDKLGIDPPKGVLLYGPPGTGKTLIARAIANEVDANFYHINGPEIIRKFYGESEAKLREIFEEASKNAPSIIFIDEIDAIAQKREETHGEVEKRVVAQLLTLMDGLKSRDKVIVIAATNIPNTLDPALRRPGRFDREIEIGIPDVNGRYDILRIHTRGMPLKVDVDLKRLAEITHGFVGADLEALCKESAMLTLRKYLANKDLRNLPSNLDDIAISMEDFYEALKEIEPSAIREVYVEVPDVSWDDIGGLHDVKQELIQTIEWPFKYKELFTLAKCTPPKGIILYGPPGTGKTLLAKAAASQSEANFISVKGPAILSKWVGESEKHIREIFKKAKQASPCIIFFDEIDALLPVRGSDNYSDVSERIIGQMLTEIDGIEELHGVIIIGATNRIDMIDPAVLRPGRFDLILELKKPNYEERLEMFKIHTRGKPLCKDVDLSKYAMITDGMVGADISFICQRASMFAIKEFIQSNEKDLNSFNINNRHFEMAMKSFDEVRKNERK